ncbi:MAG TPA: tetratricopeptide repeat-containing protein, partial [Longimicrobium sp.]|nr:tetratricopeptide repeat-containing protein [Longimicrobium sp.]
VAGWAVADNAAMAFATTFYERLLAGRRFIDAVADARAAAHALGGNTWAAYQCYGDPDWVFRRQSADAMRAPAPPADELGSVASAATLALALQTMAVTARFDDGETKTLPGRIRALEESFREQWGHLGEVAEAFAEAWVEAGDRSKAVEWFRRALAANDGRASMRAAEKLGNLRARLAWESVERARESLAGFVAARPSDAEPAADQPSPPTRAEAEAALQRALSDARREIAGALELLERLVAVQPTMERESLCGSAWKRKAMLEAVAGQADEEATAIARMEERYAKAEMLARDTRDPELFYPALNRMAAALIVDGGKPGWSGFDPKTISAVRDSLNVKLRQEPDFWSMVGQTELRLYEAVAAGALAQVRDSLELEYGNLHARVYAPWMWRSVRDQIRFVLVRYQARATDPEREAVAAILERLEAFTRA